MMNTHDLNSQSRFAHAQRLSEANQYRLTKIATDHPERTTRTPRYRWKSQLIAAIFSRLRVARATASSSLRHVAGS